MFTQEELKNLSSLLVRVDIKGAEALAVVLLQQKIKTLLEEKPKVVDNEEKPSNEEK